MAATVQSLTTANPGNGSSITLTKPTGLAVGDLMVFHYAYGDATDTMSTKTDWTHEIDNQGAGGTSIKTGIQWKVADAGDVAASDFVFSLTGASVSPIGALLRIDGYIASDLLNDAAQLQGNTGSPTYSNSVTPISANSLLLFFVTVGDPGASPDVSGYAIATSNPSWTEQYQVNVNSSHCVAMASATRPETTATGNSSATVSGSGSQDSYGIMVAIGSIANVSVTGTTGIINLVGNEGASAAGANVTGTTGVLNLVGNEGTVATPDPMWTNQNKNSSNWTNQNKS